METLEQMFRIGRGPSSSHTIGPSRIMKWYLKQFPTVNRFKVTLFGSLALTGKGHLTDLSLQEAIGDRKLEIIWDVKTQHSFPNVMYVQGFDKSGKALKEIHAKSIGGGAIEIDGYDVNSANEVYPQNTYKAVKDWCKRNHKDLVGYVKHFDKKGYAHLKEAWKTMKQSVELGLSHSGMYTNPIRLSRKAKMIYDNLKKKRAPKDSIYYAMAYGYAASEVNVEHGYVVTGPTLGSTGIVPAVLYYAIKNKGFKESKIIDALAVAGTIGNPFKKNGSIAGAIGGCQAECGTACSMAAAAYCYLLGGNMEEIEAAAIIAMEHHLGLTCDAIIGYVYSPCIERNGVMALRAINSAEQALLIKGTHEIFDLDDMVIVEKRTGDDLNPIYRETGLGGLSLRWKEKYHKDSTGKTVKCACKGKNPAAKKAKARKH